METKPVNETQKWMVKHLRQRVETFPSIMKRKQMRSANIGGKNKRVRQGRG